MQIHIEVVDVTIVDKGKYKVAEVTCKQDGKTNTKKIMSFGAQADTFKVFANGVKKGDLFEVNIEKNADGYWDWLKATPGGTSTNAGTADVPGKPSAAPNRGNYETPEERTARQEYIIRQSSLSNAIAFLNHTKKSYEPIEIIDLAESFVMWVYKKGNFATGGQAIDPDADVQM